MWRRRDASVGSVALLGRVCGVFAACLWRCSGGAGDALGTWREDLGKRGSGKGGDGLPAERVSVFNGGVMMDGGGGRPVRGRYGGRGCAPAVGHGAERLARCRTRIGTGQSKRREKEWQALRLCNGAWRDSADSSSGQYASCGMQRALFGRQQAKVDGGRHAGREGACIGTLDSRFR